MMSGWIGRFITALIACAVVWQLGGCTTHGLRKWELQLLGNTISFEDETYADSDGKRDYKLTFDEVDGLEFSHATTPVKLGGTTAITTEQSFVHNIDSVSDGVDGPSDVDQAGQKVTFSVTSEDVLKLIDLLITTFTGAEWFGHESGAATYGKGTLVNPVCHSGRFNAGRGSYATISVDGTCRFPDAAATFDDVEGFDDGQSAPTLTHPGRQWEPGNAVHNALTALHVQSLGFTIPGKVLEDFDAGDKGVTAVDKAGYGVVAVELTIRDTTQQTGPPTHDLATALMLNGVEDLVVPLIGVGDTVSKTLTLRNCRFRSKRKAMGRDWTGWTLLVLHRSDVGGGIPPELARAWVPRRRLFMDTIGRYGESDDRAPLVEVSFGADEGSEQHDAYTAMQTGTWTRFGGQPVYDEKRAGLYLNEANLLKETAFLAQPELADLGPAFGMSMLKAYIEGHFFVRITCVIEGDSRLTKRPMPAGASMERRRYGVQDKGLDEFRADSRRGQNSVMNGHAIDPDPAFEDRDAALDADDRRRGK